MADKLHVGCGQVALPGWVNIDSQDYPAVDVVLDVTRGLPFSQIRFVFAEHFLEHLPYDAARSFLSECRRVLRADGVLRLSTPNLDWVYATHYHPGQWQNRSEQIRDCFNLNKAFRGWGHQFLYNLETLRESLAAAGFAEMSVCAYGESAHEELRELERHEKYHDDPTLPHVLVVEASGRAKPRSSELEVPLADFRQAVSAR